MDAHWATRILFLINQGIVVYSSECMSSTQNGYYYCCGQCRTVNEYGGQICASTDDLSGSFECNNKNEKTEIHVNIHPGLAIIVGTAFGSFFFLVLLGICCRNLLCPKKRSASNQTQLSVVTTSDYLTQPYSNQQVLIRNTQNIRPIPSTQASMESNVYLHMQEQPTHVFLPPSYNQVTGTSWAANYLYSTGESLQDPPPTYEEVCKNCS